MMTLLHRITWQNAVGLAIFVILCGFLAYWGDLLGRRMGKRRLSLLGLRPRHTAIAVTTITGMLIAALTIGTMAGLSQQVRLLMLRGFEIVSERRMMEHRLRATYRAYHRATRQFDEEKLALEGARKDAAAARRERDEIVAEKAHLIRSLADLNVSLSKSKVALRVAQGSLGSAKRELDARRLEIGKQQAAIADLDAKRVRLESTEKMLAHAAQEAVDHLNAMLERNITFRPGDEVVRTVVNGSKPKAEIRRKILALLADAEQRARKLGCAPGEDGHAIKLVTVELNPKHVTESDVVDAITENIAAGRGSVVARVISLSNTVAGEQTLANVVLNPDRLVYKAREEVASTTIDGSLARGLIFGGLVQFFKTNVRASAMRHGIIAFTDDDGQPTVGQIPGDTLFALVDRIKAADTRVRVHAMAANPTWSADNLVLEFRVSDVP